MGGRRGSRERKQGGRLSPQLPENIASAVGGTLLDTCSLDVLMSRYSCLGLGLVAGLGASGRLYGDGLDLPAHSRQHVRALRTAVEGPVQQAEKDRLA